MQSQFIKNNISLVDWYVIILITVAFAMPLSRKLVVYPLAAAFLFSFFLPGFRNFLANAIKEKTVLLFWSFFIVQLLGFFVTESKAGFGFEIETKLSFLVIPFIFRNDILSSVHLEKIKKGFIQGSVFAALINLAGSSYRYYFSREIESFFYVNFSSNIHTSYFSSYLVLSIAFILFSKKMRARPFWWLVLALLTGAVFLCFSRAGILCLLMVVFLYSFTEMLNPNNRKPLIIVLGILLLMLVPLIFAGNFKSRFKQAFQTDQNQDQSIEAATAFERLSVWRTSLDLIKRNFFWGTGEADVRHELTKEYKEKGLAFAEKHQLNCHNQFLQTLLANGIVGFINLVLILYILFRNFRESKSYVVLSFLIITLIGFMFESMLETQAGIVFFTFFYFLLMRSVKKTEVLA